MSHNPRNNPKADVIRSDRNEPVINDDYVAFAEDCSCAVYPVRVRPHKALVENAVKPLYRSVYFNMRMVFFSLDEFNIAIIFPCLISMKG